jgi:hypothetical protein
MPFYLHSALFGVFQILPWNDCLAVFGLRNLPSLVRRMALKNEKNIFSEVK